MSLGSWNGLTSGLPVVRVGATRFAFLVMALLGVTGTACGTSRNERGSVASGGVFSGNAGALGSGTAGGGASSGGAAGGSSTVSAGAGGGVSLDGGVAGNAMTEGGARDAGAGVAGVDTGGAAPSQGGGGGRGAVSSLGAVYSGVPLFDTSGNLVNAHGVGFLKQGNTYYMIGEQRSGKNDSYTGLMEDAEDLFTGVSLYSTTDFVNWTFLGTIIEPIAGTILGPPYYGERPKILHNASTSKYVVYIKMLNYTGGNYVGYFAVLTSSAIAGPYTYHGNLSLSGADDFEVFEDTDGQQYFVRSSGHLYKLKSDGLDIASEVKSGIQSGEGPSLFRTGDTYFWQSSQGTYWKSNDNSYASTSSLTGTWTEHGNFCPSGSKTWQSQDTAVVTVTGSAGTTYIYVGDRWVNGALPASTLVMQPLNVTGTTESIPTYHPAWQLDVAAGTWSPVTPSGTTVNDSATGTSSNQFDYSSGWTSESCSQCFNGDSHSSAMAGSTASLSFNGTQVLLYAAYSANAGIMTATIFDGSGAARTPEAQISLRYDAAPAGNYLVYASPILPAGSYTLKVRITGLEDHYSTSAACNIDRALIVP